MNKPDWTSIKRDYVETSLTLAEVNAKWGGLNVGTLSSRATRQKWNEQKQQFAAKLESAQREKNLAKRVAEQAKFESDVAKVAQGQLLMIVRQMNEKSGADAIKLVRLTNALEKLQRIGAAAFGKGIG